jgi:hypothetical protein
MHALPRIAICRVAKFEKNSWEIIGEGAINNLSSSERDSTGNILRMFLKIQGK